MYGGEGEEGLLGQVDAMLQADDASRHGLCFRRFSPSRDAANRLALATDDDLL